MKIKVGIYEQVINSALKDSLFNLNNEQFDVLIHKIDAAESKVILARYMEEVLLKSLQLIKEKCKDESGLQKQVEVCNQIISSLSHIVPNKGIEELLIDEEAQQILAIFEKQMSIFKQDLHKLRPESSISISSLFTGSRNEPQMVSELKREILSADRIDLLVSFIKWSGLRLIINELGEFCKTKPLRVITTTYMGATEEKAVMELAKLPNTEIKISYDTRSSRLHAKAYYFHRDNGFSTAYVGSSNLSSSAISGGLEWNVKVTNKDLPHVIRNIQATFDTYWDDRDFSPFHEQDSATLRKALDRESKQYEIASEYLFDIEPFPFQKEILQELEAERSIHNRYRNLLVAATGTGKTVVSAFDYRRFCEQNPQKENRLLFIAHREEILKQSLLCFRGVLKDNNFGELFVGQFRPKRLDHLFMSIQTFTSQDFSSITDSTFYDFIIVDETHHGSAPTYHNILTHYKPKILLGLTATPERMDGSDIKDYYDGVIASEIRLPEAINRNLLVPFQYFCVSDNTDLSQVRFERGKYDVSELNALFSQNESRSSAILESLNRYVSNINDVKALGFCVSKIHAQFMAKFFSQAGAESIALTDESGREERNMAQDRLKKGEIKVIFTVDLYNEGVDIPAVNTVLFLRPTESLTVFLQQLGRGLRLYPGKEELTVLDFIGQANKKYNFERKFQALAEVSNKSVVDLIEHGFSNLPKGCYIQMERMAQEYVLQNIRNATVNKAAILNKIRTYEGDTGKPLQLGAFLEYNNINLHEIYSKGTFTGLKVQANISSQLIDSELESVYQRFFARITHVDSRRWISTVIGVLQNDKKIINEDEEKILLMLYFDHPLGNKGAPRSQGYTNILDFVLEIRTSIYNQELLDILQYKYNKIKFVDKQVDLGYHNVLDLHCSYTRDEILAGLGINSLDRRQPSREGVYYSKKLKTDLLFVNLHKSEKEFSPTTMYEDYAINEELFHWQTQSSTSQESDTGQRYINHQKEGSQVLMFVRKSPKDASGKAAPFMYLGKMNYVRHYGNRPVSIVWKLEDPMPAHILEMARVTYS